MTTNINYKLELLGRLLSAKKALEEYNDSERLMTDIYIFIDMYDNHTIRTIEEMEESVEKLCNRAHMFLSRKEEEALSIVDD